MVSVINKFMKMYSNTISIVHSNFRRKESLYYLFRPYFCHEQTPVLGTYSFLYISSKIYLKHFIMKLFEIELEVKTKLKVSLIIPPTLWPSAA